PRLLEDKEGDDAGHAGEECDREPAQRPPEPTAWFGFGGECWWRRVERRGLQDRRDGQHGTPHKLRPEFRPCRQNAYLPPAARHRGHNSAGGGLRAATARVFHAARRTSSVSAR